MVDKTIPQLYTDNTVTPVGATKFEVDNAGTPGGSDFDLLFTFVNTQTFTSPVLKRYSETTATATAAIDRANGGIQTFTMTANSTITVTMNDGESLTLHLNGGATYTVTWPTMTWVGGSVPTLTAADVIQLWKKGGTLYGAYVGAV